MVYLVCVCVCVCVCVRGEGRVVGPIEAVPSPPIPLEGGANRSSSTLTLSLYLFSGDEKRGWGGVILKSTFLSWNLQIHLQHKIALDYFVFESG